jgi:DNA-binding MarR family transcriptional regulator
MNNKHLGIILLVLALIIGGLVYTFNELVESQNEMGCTCQEHGEEICPHQSGMPWQTHAGIVVVSVLAALAVYILFFEKSQQEIISALKRQKELKIEEEKFSILLKGLDKEEKKVIKAVKEQDGISQNTLRLRTDLHKSKLSIVLDGLEKKHLIKKVKKGKTNQVFLKVSL